MAKRREFNVFSLSFLDIMSCGFGAVILIYIVINHATEVESQVVNKSLMAEVKKIEEDIKIDTENLVQLKNTLNVREDEIVTTESLAIEIVQELKDLESLIAAMADDGQSKDENIEALKAELKRLETEAANLEGSVAADERSGSSLRSIVGQGDRQYLTGLKIGGEHILILVDASASMLDREIVNVIRRRNMSEEAQRASPKWQRAIKTVEWVLANIPSDSSFQLVTFNTDTHYMVEGSEGRWLSAVERESTDGAINNLKMVVPAKGTSLIPPFDLVQQMNPRPDNLFLIIDSLPTMGAGVSDKSVVESRDRVKYFQESTEVLPQNIPVNIILFPMEGDPLAAPTYWQLSQITGGSFLSPSDDWP